MKYLYLLVFSVFFIGCSPRYVVKTEYIPLNNINSKQCVNECLSKKSQCQKSCDVSYDNCLSSAFNSAKESEKITNKQYQNRYAKYIDKLNNYRYYMVNWQESYDQNSRDFYYFHKRCKKHKDMYACKRESDVKAVIDNLIQNKPQKPIPPKRVTFNQILLKQQSLCKEECGCKSDYDVCFTSCGGEIVLHKICVQNCN